MPEFDEEEMPQDRSFRKREFTLEDFRKQLSPLQKVMGLIPGMHSLHEMIGDIDLKEEMKRQFGVIDSMTLMERQNPSKVINESRRRRIAEGAGVQPNEVTDLLKQFEAMSKMLTTLSTPGLRERWVKRNYPFNLW